MKKWGVILLKDVFKRPNKKKKYATMPRDQSIKQDIPDGLLTRCASCKKVTFTKEFLKNSKVCPHCDHHHVMNAKERIESFADVESFVEFNGQMTSANPLEFPDYLAKIEGDRKKTKLNEAVVTGVAKVEEHPVILTVMDSTFRMGSMGTVVGEKITLAIEKADELGVPFVIFTASGGARMQEGVLSLMQMAKTSAALKMFSDRGGLAIVVMTHPTTGGVSASFASLGDYNLAEPGALIGFAGRRIIEQTIHEKLPNDFQTAEFLLKFGQLDAVIHRNDLRKSLSTILEIHGM